MTLRRSFGKQVEAFDFLPHIKQETNARMRIRLLALQLLKEGKKVVEICSILKIAKVRIPIWVKRFLSQGIEGLKELSGRGRKPKISEQQKVEVAKFIEERSKSSTGGRLFGEDIIKFISDTFNQKYSLSSAYNIMHELGFSWITSRSIHPKADLKSQEMFKKNFSKI